MEGITVDFTEDNWVGAEKKIHKWKHLADINDHGKKLKPDFRRRPEVQERG
jgi:hypothetical protein